MVEFGRKFTSLFMVLCCYYQVAAQTASMSFYQASLQLSAGHYDLINSWQGQPFGGHLGTFSCTDNLLLKGFEARTASCNGCKTKKVQLLYRIYRKGTIPSQPYQAVQYGQHLTLPNTPENCLADEWLNTSHNALINNNLPDGDYILACKLVADTEDCTATQFFSPSSETDFTAEFSVATPMAFSEQPKLKKSVTCLGDSAQIFALATGASNYIWQRKAATGWENVQSGQIANSADTISYTTPKQFSTQTYRLVVTNCSGNNQLISQEITWQPQQPTFKVQPLDAAICISTTLDLFASIENQTPKTKWQWQRNDSGAGFVSLPADTTANLKIRSITAGYDTDLFRCIITDGFGCKDTTQTATVTVNRESTVLSTANTLCEKSPNRLIARVLKGNALGFQWKAIQSGTAYSNLANNAIYTGVTNDTLLISAMPLTPTRYQAAITFERKTMDDTGKLLTSSCIRTENESFTVHPLPAPPTPFAASRCGAGSLTLTSPLNVNGRWYADTTQAALHTGSSYTVNATASTTLYFSFLNSNGCESYRRPVILTVHPVPSMEWLPLEASCPNTTTINFPYAQASANATHVSIASAELPNFIANVQPITKTIAVNYPSGLKSGNYAFTLQAIDTLTSCRSAAVNRKLTVKDSLVIQAGNTFSPTCEGSNFTTEIQAKGADFLQYKWLKNNIATSDTSNIFTIQHLLLTDAGIYSIEVTDACTSRSIILDTLEVLPAPKIVKQPLGSRTCFGSSAVFSVEATGYGIQQYQWKLDGVAIGSNAPTLKLDSLQSGGSVWCEITASCGKIVSDTARLVVVMPPPPPAAPEQMGYCQGATPQPLVATALPNHTLQWRLTQGGEALSTPPTPPTSQVDTLIYFVNQVTAEGCVGQQKSLKVIISPPITSTIVAWKSAICKYGILNRTTAIKTIVNPNNVSPLVYSWRLNGNVLPPTTDSIQITESGLYRVEVKAGYCQAEAVKEIKSIGDDLGTPPTALAASGCAGNKVILSASSSYTGGSFLWYDSPTFVGAVADKPIFESPPLTQSYTYYVSYSRRENGITCETNRTAVTAVVTPFPTITTQPINVSQCSGNTARFSVSGSGASSWQWERKLPTESGFVSIPNATSATLNVSNVGNAAAPHGTQYRVKVSNGDCSIYSEIAILYVNNVVGTIASQTVCVGSDVRFSTPTVVGEAAYQWQRRAGTSGSWADMVGETSAELFLPKVSVAENDTYYRCRLIFRNLDGSSCVKNTDDGRLTVKAISVELAATQPLCHGDSSGRIVATASGGTSPYVFSLNSTTSNSTGSFTNLQSGFYKVTITDKLGCQVTDSIELVSPPALVIDKIETTSATCQTLGSLTALAHGGQGKLTYKLSNGLVNDNGIFTSLAGGSYTITVSDSVGCVVSRDVVIIGKEVPVVLASPISQTDCAGNGVKFTTTITPSSSQIQWERMLPNETVFVPIVGATLPTLSVNNIGNEVNPHGTLYRAVASNDGCTVWTDTVSLSVNRIVGSASSQTICAGKTVQLSLQNFQLVGDVSQYEWQFRKASTGSWTSLGQSTDDKLTIESFSSVNVGFYRCKVTFSNPDASVCTEYHLQNGQQLLLANTAAPIIKANQTLICGSQTVTLTATGCAGITRWSNNQTGSSLQVNTAGTYYAWCEATCPTDTSNLITVTTGILASTPTIIADKDTLCEGENTWLRASGCNGAIRWSTGAMADSILVSEAGSYTAKCVTSCGESSESLSVKIIKLNLPSAGIIATSKTPQCSGYNPPAIQNISSPTHYTSLQWERRTLSADWEAISGANGVTYNPTNLTETTIFRRKAVNQCGTAISNADTLNISPDPTIVIVASADSLCAAEPLTLQAETSGGAGTCAITWQRNNRSAAPTSDYWEDVPQQGSTLHVQSLINPLPNQITVYFRANYACLPSSCQRSTSAAIGVVLKANNNLLLTAADTLICRGNSTQLTATGCGGNLSWADEALNLGMATTQKVSPDTTTTYTARCQTSCGIQEKQLTVHVRANMLPLPTSTTPPYVVQPDSLVFSAIGQNLRWYATATSKQSTSQPPIYKALGSYTRYVSQSDGICESERLLIGASIYKALTISKITGNRSECKGNSDYFSVDAVGVGKLTYQWQRKRPNEAEFINLTDADAHIDFWFSPDLKVSNVGNNNNPHLTKYRCIVTDEISSATTDEMTLLVNGLTGNFPNVKYCMGQVYDESVDRRFAVTGEVASYQWQHREGTSGEWTNLTETSRFKGTQSPNLRILNLQPTDEAYYRCLLRFTTTTCTEATDASKLSVGQPPIPQTPINLAYCQGDKAKKLTMKPSEDGNDIRWLASKTDSVGSAIAPIPTTDYAGETIFYAREITENGCVGPVNSIIVTVHAPPPPPINTTPSVVKSGSVLQFSAQGTSLQWYSSLSDKTASAIAPSYTTAKTYTVYVTQQSAEGCESDRLAITSTIRPLLLVSGPQHQADCDGNSVTFSVSAKGVGELRYQWQIKTATTDVFTDLSQEKTNKLTLQNIGSLPHVHGSKYRCLVSDAADTTVSAEATLQVYQLKGLVPNVTRCEGELITLDTAAIKVSGIPKSLEWQRQEANTWQTVEGLKNFTNWGEAKVAITDNYRLKATFQLTPKTTCVRYSPITRIEVRPRPQAPAPSTAAACIGTSFQPSLKPSVNTATLAWYYSVSDSISFSTKPTFISPTSLDTTYYVAERSKNGCESIREKFNLKWLLIPDKPLTDSVLNVCQFSKTVQLKAQSAYPLLWYSGSSDDASDVPPSLTPAQAGTQYYAVKALASSGCQSSVQRIRVNIAPCYLQGTELVEYDCLDLTPAINVSGSTWRYLHTPDGRIAAAIQPNGQNLGTITAELGYRPTRHLTTFGTPYLSRYLRLSSTAGTHFSKPIGIKVYFSRKEFPISFSPLYWMQYSSITEDCRLETNENFKQGRSVAYDGAEWEMSENGGFASISTNYLSEIAITTHAFARATMEIEQQPTSVKVAWKFMEEIRPFNYFMERSTDGQEWYTWQTFKPYGPNHLIDNQPLDGVSYYRLVFQDLEGTFKYLPTVRSERPVSNQPRCSIFPNPTVASQWATLYLQGMKLKEIVLTNMREQQQTLATNWQQPSQWQIKMPDQLPAGLYIIEAKGENDARCQVKLSVK